MDGGGFPLGRSQTRAKDERVVSGQEDGPAWVESEGWTTFPALDLGWCEKIFTCRLLK